jgi:uncharacterized membrane protein
MFNQQLMAKIPKIEKSLPYFLIILGLIGLICAFILMYDNIQLIKNPAYKPSCSLNPIISCGNVINSSEGSLLGFPNPIIGLIAFPPIITVGVLAAAGAKFRKQVWQILLAGSFLGVLFIHYLFVQSVYHIKALCPYCMVTWVVMIGMFMALLTYSIRAKTIAIPKKLSGLADFISRHPVDIAVAWYLLIAGAILQHFWYYWKTLF